MEKTETTRKKTILIGLDGMIPEQVMRYRKRVVELDRLLKEGFFSPAVPSFPTDTPTNWTTIATGAWAGTHGIVGFGVHKPGMETAVTTPTFNSRQCQGEYFWQAAERQGKRCLLINYPTAFPLTLNDGVAIGGDGLMSSKWTVRYHELISSSRDVSRVKPLAMGAAKKWKNVPPDWEVVAEGVVDLDRERRFGWGAAGVTDQGDVEIVASKRRYVLVIRDGGTSKIVLSASRDVKKAITTIGKGEWSGWIDERFGGKRALRQYKLVDLSADGSKVTIYGSMAATPTGWGFPKGIEKKIIEHAGGYVEALELSPDAAFRAGWFGRDKMGQIMDIMELQADWTVKCAQYLADTEEWDAMFVQFHAPDGINHDILGDMESEDPSIRRRADEWLGETYRVLFKMVDEIRNACADKNTHVCVVSDHGNIPIRKWINLPGILMRQNWLEFAEDTGSKRWSVDPTKTVCWHAEHQSGVWINVAGREKSGLVKRGAEYESLRWRIIDHLRRVVDEETGEPVFAVVARREDLQSLGVWGNRFADILCIANPQYLTYVERVGDLPKQDVDAYLAAPDVVDIADAPLSASLRALTAVHWHLPTASVGYASNCGCFIMTGPGVAQGMSGEWVNLVDVAPTLAHCLGIEPPAHAEGRIVREAFD